MNAALIGYCLLLVTIAIGVSLRERPKRNRYRRSYDRRDWMSRYRQWWA